MRENENSRPHLFLSSSKFYNLSCRGIAKDTNPTQIKKHEFQKKEEKLSKLRNLRKGGGPKNLVYFLLICQRGDRKKTSQDLSKSDTGAAKG